MLFLFLVLVLTTVPTAGTMHLTKSSLRKKGLFWLVIKEDTVMVGREQQQEHDVADHTASRIGSAQLASSFSLRLQPSTLAHGMEVPVFTVDLSSRLNLSRETLTDASKGLSSREFSIHSH